VSVTLYELCVCIIGDSNALACVFTSNFWYHIVPLPNYSVTDTTSTQLRGSKGDTNKPIGHST
jgi:hypothetical protein